MLERDSFPAVFNLICLGHWRSTNGPKREFVLLADVPVRIPNNHTVTIGDEHLSVNMYRLSIR
ncbi:hypothetical protein ACTQ9L_11180 [Deinococcus wulumuqiensis]